MMETLKREDSLDSLALIRTYAVTQYEERSKCRDDPEVGLCFSPKNDRRPSAQGEWSPFHSG